MRVDHILILAAGKGTRMGKIGESLPKVIWPVFSKTLLELEVCYARELFPDAQIYINIFNYAEVVKSHIQSSDIFKGVTILEEKEVLDIGGGIHNLADKVDYKGRLLTINSDQFLMCEKEEFYKASSVISQADIVLFSYNVKKSDGYNALSLEGTKFLGVIKNKDLKHEEVCTYTGMSLINLESLSLKQGESKFFESVANPNERSIHCINLDEVSYWDFGTLERYYNSMFEVLRKNKNKDSFVEFLVRNKAIFETLCKKLSYNGKCGINLTGNPTEIKSGDILISGFASEVEENSRRIIWNGITEIL